MNWLVAQKTPDGAWPSTQATVLALKALLAGADRPLGADQPQHIEIAIDGEPFRTLTIPPEEAEVVRSIDLSQAFSQGGRRIHAAALPKALARRANPGRPGVGRRFDDADKSRRMDVLARRSGSVR